MKQKFFHILLLLLCTKFFAQTDYKIWIDGHVKENNLAASNVVNATIHLRTDLGDELIEETDTNGYYSFQFKMAAFKQATLSIATNKRTHRSNTKQSCYLASLDKGFISIDTSVKAKHYIKDFQVVIAEDACQPFIPVIVFQHQSLVYDTVYSSYYIHNSDSAFDIPSFGLKLLSKMLKENPTVIIRINGNASFNEKLPVELSALRAEKVKLELMKLGIEEARLHCIANGISRPLINQASFKLAKKPGEKEALHTRNRRCTFSILSWDYGIDPNKPIDRLENQQDD